MKASWTGTTPDWEGLKSAIDLGSGNWDGNPSWSDLEQSYGIGRIDFTPESVISWLGIDLTEEERPALDSIVIGVSVTVTDWHGPAHTWSFRVVLGAIMLAAHLWRRRGTPGGVAGFTEEGVSYVQRHDPQAAMLLGLGGWTRPAVG